MSKLEIKEFLLKAGWSPGRSVGITDEIEALKLYGLEPHEKFIQFMSEFGGLRINCHFYKMYISFHEEVDINLISDLYAVNKILNKNLIAIGSDADLMVYLLDDDGKFYSFLNGDVPGGRLFFLGSNSEEFFERAFFQDGTEPVIDAFEESDH